MKKSEIQLVRLLLFVAVALVLPGCSEPEKHSGAKPEGKAQAQTARDERTALDEYVARPDTNYSYRVLSRIPGKDHQTIILEMTSQAWLTTAEVDRPIWKHWMTIVQPTNVAHP